MRPVVSLRDVGKTYGRGPAAVSALAAATLDVLPGELLGIVGPSGSGKTTLLTLAGLVEPPSTGIIRLGEDIVVTPATRPAALRRMRRHHVGFVFQKANLVGFLTASENVELAAAVQGDPPAAARRRARELLASFGLGHRLDNYPAALSGGEQQRVALARSLVGSPALLLADEPTASLDGDRRDLVMGLLRSLAASRGVAICVVTHDARTLSYFDRIIRISDGRVWPEPFDPAFDLRPANAGGEATP